MEVQEKRIQAKKVAGSRRLRMLPKYFPSVYMMVENAVYNVANMLCSEYRGGFWDFYEVPNGGFFMALDKKMELCNPLNYSDEEMSGEAAGITICIYAYERVGCAVMDKFPNIAEKLFRQMDLLKDYADQHPEGAKIFRLID
jgi:hypothetical protein